MFLSVTLAEPNQFGGGFVLQSKWERKFPHWIEGSVKRYSTLVLTIWFVSAYEYAGNELTIWFVSACEYAGDGSRYEA